MQKNEIPDYLDTFVPRSTFCTEKSDVFKFDHTASKKNENMA